ncbi:MAG TPA: hypothetical protein VGH32_01840 [Pirellulales bacterium]
MSILEVDRETYIIAYNASVARYMDWHGFDLRAAREQTAWDMRDWAIRDDVMAREFQRDKDDQRNGDWTR